MKYKELWIVGQVKDYKNNNWEFQGIFDSENKAIKSCRSDNYFIGLVKLNQSLPHKTIMLKYWYYPSLEDKHHNLKIK